MDLPQFSTIMANWGAPTPTDTVYALSRTYAEALDASDPLQSLRSEFHIPTLADLASEEPPPPADPNQPVLTTPSPSQLCIYFCGNSLGLQPKRTAALINEELSIWATRGVTGHFRHPRSRPWVSIDEGVTQHLATVVGAKAGEVAAMGSLTGNIHLLLAGFYKPTASRWKVIMEGRAFPSDHYAIVSQLQWHRYDDKNGLILINPEYPSPVLSTEQILRTIDQNADETALLFLPGVQYYTGQAFDIATITTYAHSKGITVGWDLAHAAGNIELRLHDWGVDFAAWCSYKYLNSGPGGIAGIFVHEKHDASSRHRLAGWWGHDKATRFQMDTQFLPLSGASGYQLSNPSVLDTTAHLASLELFSIATPAVLQQKSRQLTSYLYYLLTHPLSSASALPDTTPSTSLSAYTILTPIDPAQRGAQLSIHFPREGMMMKVFEKLSAAGVVVDERKPDVIRVAPTPSYNTYGEVWEFVQIWWMKVEEVVAEMDMERGMV